MTILMSAKTHEATPSEASRRAVMKVARRDMASLSVGYVPFAVAIGATIATADVDKVAGWAGGPIIAAGSAHLTLIELLAGGAGALAAAAVAITINARIVAYSAGLAPWFSHESVGSRLAIAFFVIDPTYLLAIQRFEADDPGPELRKWYFIGLGSMLYPTWTASIAIGLVAGNVIPPGLELTMAAPLMMVGMLAMSVDKAPVNKAVCGPSTWLTPNRAAAVVGLALGAVSLGLPAPAVTLIAAIFAMSFSYARTSSTSEPEQTREETAR
jgi:predicted branched-subunit amino acid permease